MGIRVSELSKRLGQTNADVKDYLAEIGSPVKSASNSIDDETAARVESHFKPGSGESPKGDRGEEKDKAGEKPASKAEAKKPPQEKKATEAKDALTKEPSGAKAPARPVKKKKKIVAVINRQYLNGGTDDRRMGGRGGRPQDGRRRPQGSFSSSSGQRRLIRPRSGSGPIRPDGTRIGEPTLAEQRKKEREEEKLHAAEAEAAAEKKAERELSREPEKAPSAVRRPLEDRKPKTTVRPARPAEGKKEGGRAGNAGAVSPDKRRKDGKKKDHNNKDRNFRTDRNDRNKERNLSLEKNPKKHPAPKPKENKEEEIKSIKLPDHITIRELAERMHIEPAQIIKKLFLKGEMLTLNSDVEYDKAEEIALEFNILCEHEEKVDIIADLLKEDEDDPDKMVARPPVVCVMGHVDHGKTSLLDAIRDTRITDREAGGITQKIGAYVVSAKGRKITFLDTPGHEAFTAMRMRGANSTDIAVLVVAADDGVMPQTVEAINHAKAAGVEIIVAVNKIDKPNANVDRVKQELAEYELIPEDWGGSTIFVPVSAKTHQGIGDLLDMILLTADVMELKANPKQKARGVVIEARLDKGRGAVATVLVQKGTLHVGDPVSAGPTHGKVRAMADEDGKRVKAAGPSTPVEIQGLSDVPNAGEILIAHDSDKDARSFAQEFVTEEKTKLVQESRSRMSLDNLHNQIEAGDLKELDLIVKADVQGSVEAVKQSLEKLSNDEVMVKVIHGGVGAITESDVVLASASNAIIIGFNVRPDAVAKNMAEEQGVDIHLYNVIYNAIEDVQGAMKGMLEPVYEEKVIGHLEVRQTFKASGVGVIAGAFVTDGLIERGAKIRLSRGKDQLFDGALASLKRFKDDAKEVKQGFDCGVVLDGWQDIQEGDIMEAYKMVEVPRE